MEDNHPQAQNCPICATRSDLWPTFGDYRDFDCLKCGRIRITGSALGSFPPRAIARFDRLWLVSWVKRIPAENGPHQNRRLITAAYLDGLETMRRLMTELGIAETEATALAGPVFEVADISAAVVARAKASQKRLALGSNDKDGSID